MILPILVVAWESQQGSGGSLARRSKPTMSLCSLLDNGLLDLVSNAKALGYPGMHVFCPQEITLQPSSYGQPPTSLWQSRRFQQLNIFLTKRSSQVPPTAPPTLGPSCPPGNLSFEFWEERKMQR